MYQAVISLLVFILVLLLIRVHFIVYPIKKKGKV
jgi:hypothetical protein